MSHGKIKDCHHRWATILRLHDAGKSNREIAELVGMTPGSVWRVLAERGMPWAAAKATDTGDADAGKP